MKIKEFVWQHRRDFRAIFVCEHCGNEGEAGGYDDKNFHDNVIPTLKCSQCEMAAPEVYRPLTPKYPEDYQI